VICRRRGRQEQGVWPEQLHDGPALGPLEVSQGDVAAPAVEQQRSPSVRVPIGPLLQDPLVVDDEPIFVTGRAS